MIDIAQIREAKTHREILDKVMDALHDIGGSYFARRAIESDGKPVGPDGRVLHLTPVLRKSMEEKALTDQQIEDYSAEVWEAAAIRMHELEAQPAPPDVL